MRDRTREGLHPTRLPTMLTGVHQWPPPSVTCPDVTGAAAGERRRTEVNETETETRPSAGPTVASHAFEDCSGPSATGRECTEPGHQGGSPSCHHRDSDLHGRPGAASAPRSRGCWASTVTPTPVPALQDVCRCEPFGKAR